MKESVSARMREKEGDRGRESVKAGEEGDEQIDGKMDREREREHRKKDG